MGCSSEGFASILYGHLLKVDKCIAFSPQTIIGTQLKQLFQDERFQPNQDLVEIILKKNHIPNNYLDLQNLIPFSLHLRQLSDTGCKPHIYKNCAQIHLFPAFLRAR